MSQKPYAQHVQAIEIEAILQAQESMSRACQEVLEHYDCELESDEIADILVSCDGTWHRRGFSSLYGAVFIFARSLLLHMKPGKLFTTLYCLVIVVVVKIGKMKIK